MNDARPNSAQAHASIAVGASSSSLATLGYVFHAKTDVLQIQVNGGDVRVSVNGTDPTTSTGILWKDGSMWELSRVEAEALELIRVGAPATLEIAAFQK